MEGVVKAAKTVLPAAAIGALILYFSYHALAGDQGLAAWTELQNEEAKLTRQIDALKAGRSHAQIGQRPFEMGHSAPKVLIDLINGKKVADPLYTGLDECTPKNLGKCP